MSRSNKVVLVTGAAGFIGGRVVELLHASGTGVRAGIRRWSSAARIGRLPIDIVLCDVTDPAALDAAMDGVDAVIHCAVGDRTATVEGTRQVLDAAWRNRLDRVVHISTIDVYGDAEGEIDEGAPFETTGRAYGDSKIEAERLCWDYHSRGLPVVVLRPTIVYGPFSESWTVEFAQRFQGDSWLLPEEDCQGTCNLVYVDDVVGAVMRALESDAAVGNAFNINGPDRVTWNEYFHALNDAMGLPRLTPSARGVARASAAMMMPVRKAAKLALGHFPGLIMGLYQRNALAKRLIRAAEGMIRQTPTTSEFRFYSKVVSFPTSKASASLGYRPAFSMQDGIELSVAWLDHHGYLTRR